MDTRELKDAASDSFRKGRFAKAAEAYAQLTRLEPKEPQHLIKLGDSYRRDGRKDQAVEAYRGAVDAYAKLGVMIKAIAACKLVLEIDANQKDAQEALARLCAKRYVRRADVPTGALSGAPRPRYSAAEERGPALDIPEISSSPMELVGLQHSHEESAPDFPKSRVPANGRAPRPPKAANPIEDLEPQSVMFQETPPAPVPAPTAALPSEIDLNLDVSAPPASAAKPPPAALDEGEIALDIVESEDLALSTASATAEDEQGEELPDDALIIEPETHEERELMRSTAAAARKPATTMAGILVKATRQGDEEEVFAVSTGSDPEAEARLADAAALEVSPEPAAEAAAEPLTGPVAAGTTTAPPLSLEDILEDPPAGPTPTPVTRPLPLVTPQPHHDPVEVTDISAASLGPEVDQSNVPLFSELPRDAFVELLERISFHRVDAGTVILREGDAGKSIFVLASGRAKVVKGHGSRSSLELAILPEGAFFGEMALLNGSPRVASVIATEDSEILEITEEILRDLTRRHPSVGQSLKKFYRQRLLQNVMAISPLFKAFDGPNRRALAEKFRVREVKTNEAIISEGQITDGLFVIMHGVALVQKRDVKNGRNVPLAVLKEGDVFGEMSLLGHKPATATVLAKRRTIVLRLPKPVFDELKFTHPAVLELVSDLSDQRAKVNEAILAGKADAPREALAFL